MTTVELTLLQECVVARRIVSFHDIGMLARGGTHKELHARRTIPGGSDIAGLGSYNTDRRGTHQWPGDGWCVTHPRMAQLVLAGLTPGNLAGYTHAARRWNQLHHLDWWGTNCSVAPRGELWLTCVNASNDRLAYETSWWPEYLYVTRLMDAVVADVFDTAYDVLTTERAVDVQLTFALA